MRIIAGTKKKPAIENDRGHGHKTNNRPYQRNVI